MASVPTGLSKVVYSIAATEYATPRAVVRIDGKLYIPTKYELDLNAHGATDTARITLPLSNNPDWTEIILRDLPEVDSPVYVEIYAGFPSRLTGPSTDISQLTRRFNGVVDQYSLVLNGDEGTFECRSLAAPLVSNKVTIGLGGQQHTTVDFVKAMAARYGLKVKVVMGGAPLPLMTIFGDEFIAGIHNIGIWDLILQCAMWDDVDAWVDPTGQLWYAAPNLIERNKVDLQYGRDLERMTITHSPQFSKNVLVEVRTYSPKIKQSHMTRVTTGTNGDGISYSDTTRTVTSSPVFGTNQTVSTAVSSTGRISTSGTTSGSSSVASTSSSSTGGSFSSGFTKPESESGKERYIFYVRNLKPGDANALAQKLWRQISMHEYAIRLEMPVTQALFSQIGITSFLQVHGTPYSAAQGKYWPRRIEESFEPSSGWRWIIDAVNHELPQGAI